MLEKPKVDNDIYDISKAFALRVVNLYKYLTKEKGEFVMSKQLLRSGTSIGANVHEGKIAQSRADFLTKMNIALKESTESEYWLDLLRDGGYLTDAEYDSLIKDCRRVLAVLTKIVKTTKSTLK